MIPFYQKTYCLSGLVSKQGKATRLLCSLMAILCIAGLSQANAQVSISSTTPVTQNFDGMGSGFTLPTGFRFSHGLQAATTAATTASATVTVASTSALGVGMFVTGTGVPANSTIATIPTGTTFTLSAVAASILSGATLTFTNGSTPSMATTATTTNPSTTVTVASTATLAVGMTVVGTNVPANATIATIPNTTTFTLSTGPASGSPITSGTTLLFTMVSYAKPGNLTAVFQQTGAGSATGQSYNYQFNSTTDRAIGCQNSASYVTNQSLMVNYRNTNVAPITSLTFAFDYERYRINSTAASVDFYYSLDGTNWVAVPAGNSGAFSTAATAFHFGTAVAPANTNPTTVNKTGVVISGLNVAQNGNIYIRWNFNLSNANSQGIAVDNISATATFLPCTAPANSATALTYPSVGTGQISGSFTAASGAPSGYLVVRYPNLATPTAPTDATVYTVGSALGLGTVVLASASTTFTASGLSINTPYDFYVYSYNNTACVGPVYKSAGPLTGTRSTNGCPTFASTVQIDALASRVDGNVYNTLTDALNDLSGCPISQPTVIELQSNYVSTGETYPIKLGAISGTSSTNTLTIRPASGASNLSVSGAPTGIPIFDIDGGNWWRVDGRSGGSGTTQNLTIMNTENLTVGSSGIRLINGAQNNIITYCKVRSSNIGVAGGTINFNSGTVTAGNSNNTVSFCDVYSSPSSTSNVGIGSVGLNTANNNNSILNNNIYDFFNAAGNTYGLYISDLNTNWTVSGNSFYQTVSRVLSGGAADRIFSPIGISPTTASTVTGMNFSGNFIGGTAPNCGGSAMTISDNGTTATLVLRAIFAQVGTATATSIQGNTIQNIAMTSSSTSANQSLISAVTGSFNIGNITPNVLGASTGTGSVTFTQTTTSTAPRFSGIIAGTGTPGTIVISDNTIGSISVSNSSTGRVELAGIYAQAAATSYTISGNTIGSTSTANSLQNNTTSDSWGVYTSTTTVTNTISNNTIANLTGAGRVLGIRTDGGVNTVSGNTIRNNSSSSATSATSAIGIWMNSTLGGQTASGNTIHSLRNTDAASTSATAHGIYFTGPTTGTNLIERNFIHSLSLATSSNAGLIYGIRVLVGVFPVTIQNNMVRLGLDASGADITTGYGILGIGNASTGTTNFYFNTLYVGGTGVTGTTSNTFALLSSGSGNTRAIQNNILVNTRDGGATGNHYSFQVGGTSANPAGLTMNYNLYQTTGSNGFIGSFNSANLTDLTAVQTSVGQNANSYVCDPQLINPDGNATSVDLHILAPPVKTLVEANGLVIGGITQDIDGQTRSSLTPTDIGADAGNFTIQTGGCNTLLTWNGSVSNVWGTPANWTPVQAPSVTTPVVIPGTLTQPNITGTVNVLSLSLTGTASPTIAGGGILNVKGDASGVAGASVKGAGKIVFNGTVQQNVTGTFIVSNVDFANVTAQGVVVGSGSTFRVEPNAATGTGLVTFLNNSRLTNNGKFILGSNATATAKIGQMPATTFITGDVTMERYFPYTTEGGNWYFTGSTMSGKNFNDFADDFGVTGLSSGFGQQGGNILSSVEPERSTIFKYDETTHNTRFDTVQKIGWTIPGNENVIPGTGYRVYVKSNSNASHKVDVEGTFTQGDFTFPSISNTVLGACIPASFPCNETSNRGWNLLANPYPCDIDWDAAGAAWSKPAQMSNAWYRWNAVGNGYGVYATGVYAGATPAPANPNIISSSQSFFVKVNTAGAFSLSVKELAKSTSTNGTFQRVNTADEKIRVHLSQSQNATAYGYDAVIRFNESATDGIDAQSDFANLTGSQFQISVPVENTAMSIATFAPVTGTKSIPLHIDYHNATGMFTIRFSEMEVLSENHQVFLKDNFLGTITPVFNDSEYAFSTSNIAGNEDRFELVFSNQSVTGTSSIFNGGSIHMFPNPSVKGSALMIAITGMESNVARISINDALGRSVISRNSSINIGGTTLIQIQDNLPSGVYMVQTTCGQTTSTQKLIIK